MVTPKNSVQDLYIWSKQEVNELQSLHDSIKYLQKLEQKIDQFVSKHKLSKNDVSVVEDSIKS